MIGKAVNFIKNILNKKDSRQEIIADFHTTIIRVDDNFISSSSIILDDMLMGNIYSLKEVIVADSAEISGNITSASVSISGKVYGDIISLEFADIKGTAVISGNIRAKAIAIAPGAVINGSVRIEGEIDNRDLLAKVENRLPSNVIKEPAFITYILPDETPVKDSAPKGEIRPPETNKRTAPAAKKPAKPTETEVAPEVKSPAPNSWY